MRGFLRRQLPGLNGAVPTTQTATESQGTAPGMSPFEAFLSVELLVRQKMFNTGFPTANSGGGSSGGATTAPASGQPATVAKRTLTAVPYNPNGQDRQFLNKVMQAWKKWPTAEAAQQSLDRVLEASR